MLTNPPTLSVRGDGNCFFRAFIFAYLEDLVRKWPASKPECERVHRVLGDARQMMIGVGFDAIVFEDQLEELQLWVKQIGDNSLSVDGLLGHLTTPETSNAIVMFLRMLTSCELASREAFYTVSAGGPRLCVPACVLVSLSPSDSLSLSALRRGCLQRPDLRTIPPRGGGNGQGERRPAHRGPDRGAGRAVRDSLPGRLAQPRAQHSLVRARSVCWRAAAPHAALRCAAATRSRGPRRSSFLLLLFAFFFYLSSPACRLSPFIYGFSSPSSSFPPPSSYPTFLLLIFDALSSYS